MNLSSSRVKQKAPHQNRAINTTALPHVKNKNRKHTAGNAHGSKPGQDKLDLNWARNQDAKLEKQESRRPQPAFPDPATLIVVTLMGMFLTRRKKG
jgi:hypothetical protein